MLGNVLNTKCITDGRLGRQSESFVTVTSHQLRLEMSRPVKWREGPYLGWGRAGVSGTMHITSCSHAGCNGLVLSWTGSQQPVSAANPHHPSTDSNRQQWLTGERGQYTNLHHRADRYFHMHGSTWVRLREMFAVATSTPSSWSASSKARWPPVALPPHPPLR